MPPPNPSTRSDSRDPSSNTTQVQEAAAAHESEFWGGISRTLMEHDPGIGSTPNILVASLDELRDFQVGASGEKPWRLVIAELMRVASESGELLFDEGREVLRLAFVASEMQRIVELDRSDDHSKLKAEQALRRFHQRQAAAIAEAIVEDEIHRDLHTPFQPFPDSVMSIFEAIQRIDEVLETTPNVDIQKRLKRRRGDLMCLIDEWDAVASNEQSMSTRSALLRSAKRDVSNLIDDHTVLAIIVKGNENKPAAIQTRSAARVVDAQQAARLYGLTPQQVHTAVHRRRKSAMSSRNRGFLRSARRLTDWADVLTTY